MAELQGLQYLQKNEIKGKKCRLDSNFAFISYAHDEEDQRIVQNVFYKLYERGYNLWIDVANIPKNENSWKDAAQEALMNENDTCKVALFFRSEESLIRMPIFEELEIIKNTPAINRIIVIDIWHDDKNDKNGMNAEKYRAKLINEKKRTALNICKKICSLVNEESSAFRVKDVNNSLEELVDALSEELEADGVCADKNPQVGNETIKNDIEDEKVKTKDVAVAEQKETSVEGETADEAADSEDGYTYTIFGKEYHAGKREQGKLMYDTFAALAERCPEKIALLTKRTSVDLVDAVTMPNTKEAYPTYFRNCAQFSVLGKEYLVGTSYGLPAKLAEIRGMLKLCGESADKFELHGYVAQTAERSASGGNLRDKEALVIQQYVQDAIEDETQMHAAFFGKYVTESNVANAYAVTMGLLLQKYPELLTADKKLMTDDESIAQNYRSAKAIEVDGNRYYVETHSSTDAKRENIRKIVKCLNLSEGEVYFRYFSEAGKRSAGASGKPGLGELL